MKKIVVTFGLISGAIASLMMVATVPFMHRIGFEHGEVVGYTSIVLSFLLVFFGIRSYRENVGQGVVSFGRAFLVGILITFISCLCYVATWEVLYFNFMPDFVDQYSAHAIAKVKASGASPEVIQAKVQELARFKELYQNPLFNVAMTFVEPFPVGLVVTLVSSAILRRRTRTPR